MSDQNSSGFNEDQAKLAVWLVEWELEGILAEGEEAEAASADASIPLYTEAVKPGDIRLLIPRMGDDPLGPLYCLVLADPACEEVRHWIPFGRFSEPAVPEEWKSGWPETPLQVLCFWLARPLSVFESPASWPTRRLSGQQLLEVNAAWRAGPTPQHGPPLRHPADPRHRYLMEERERFEQYLQRPSVTLTMAEEQGPYVAESDRGAATWLRAAEGTAHYGVQPQIYCTMDEQVRIAAYLLANRSVRCTLMEADGFPCLRFEGGRIETGHGATSGPITDAITLGPESLYREAVYLVDQGGQRHLLRSVGQERF